VTKLTNNRFLNYIISDHFNMISLRLITIAFSISACGRIGLVGAFQVETNQLMLDNSLVKSQLTQLEGQQKTEKSKTFFKNQEKLEALNGGRKYNLAMLALELFLLIHFFNKYDKSVEDYNNSKKTKEDLTGLE
jgi:hypothetical protein